MNDSNTVSRLARLRASGAAGVRRFGRHWRSLPDPVRAAIVLVGAALLFLGGAIMLVLPGPGLLAIALAVGLLATEFAWARRILERARTRLRKLRGAGPADHGPDGGSEGDGLGKRPGR